MVFVVADIWFIGVSVLVMVSIMVILSSLLLVAVSKLVPQGTVTIAINDDPTKSITTEAGQTLLTTLDSNGIFLPSACGGSGSCGACKCRIPDGSLAILPTEKTHLCRREIRDNWHLACQVKVKQDMAIDLPHGILDIRRLQCEVLSNHNVATFIKELVLKLPDGEVLNFQPGGYIQIEAPPFDVNFSNFEIEEDYRDAWDSFNAWALRAINSETITRAYSMANHPAEGNRVTLNVRIATPPWDRKTNSFANVPPGIMSSYIFSRTPGDKVTIAGPFGEFFIKDTDREMCYIGGGAGMAPLRSHIFHLFHTRKTGRKVSYWYGARSQREVFYAEEFHAIEREFPNFSFHVALSEPRPQDNWKGLTGFIHQVALNEYLGTHPAPEEVEYYLCGPPMMTKAVLTMLDNLGVEPDMIAYDDFGS